MYDVIPTPRFEKDLKFYLKKKGFTHISEDIDGIICELEKGNLLGDEIDEVKTPHRAFKVRAANSDTNSGKSNGYRIIYYAISDVFEIYLLTIYYKKDDIRVPDKKEIADIINLYCE
jgi:mRNA-degrading endonuclease RelE of RelBE toxin-antitoxin system